MTIGWQEQVRPGLALRELLTEATAALISMDAQRLEELAQCCVDLNQEVRETGDLADARAELQQATQEMKLLHRVLLETRANLTVLSRLHVLRLRERCGLAEDKAYLGSEARLRWQGLEGSVDYGDN